MLRVSGLQVSYGGLIAVADASLDVAGGEIVSLVGPNGAGKTTLFKAIIGIVPCRSGALYQRGRDVTGSSPRDRVRGGFALVPEGRRLFLGMTVEDNLRIGGAHAHNRRIIRQRLAQVYHLFPQLWSRRRNLAGELSGGEQQMCAIGRALMAGPSTILVDELSLGLSPAVADSVADRLLELRGQGAALVVVDQDLERCREIGDRLYFMYGGRTSGGDTAEAYPMLEMPAWAPPGDRN